MIRRAPGSATSLTDPETRPARSTSGHEAERPSRVICYVRADTPSLADPLAVEVSRYALAHGHAVVAQFRDSVSGPPTGRRPGFGHCLRALSAGGASAVIVPTLDHLAETERLRQWVIDEIQEFGGQVLVVSPDPVADPALAPASDPLQRYIPGPI